MKEYNLEHIFLKLHDTLFIKEYVRAYPDILHQKFEGNDLGHRLAIENRYGLLQYLINYGYSVKVENAAGKSVVTIAAEKYYFNLLKILRNTDCFEEYIDSRGQNPLFTAFKNFTKTEDSLLDYEYRQEVIQYLLDIYSLDQLDNDGDSCLFYNQNVILWQYLLTKNKLTNNSLTNFLAAAIYHNNAELFKLVTAEFDEETLESHLWQTHTGTKTPMHYAAVKDCHVADQYFKSYRFNQDTQLTTQSILHLLLKNYKIELVEDWIKQNEEVSLAEITDLSGNSLLIQAIFVYYEANIEQQNKLYKFMQLLFQTEASIARKANNYHSTPLHEAAVTSLKLVHLLTQQYMDVTNIKSVIEYTIEQVKAKKITTEDIELEQYNQVIYTLLAGVKKEYCLPENIIHSLIPILAGYPETSIVDALTARIINTHQVEEEINKLVKSLIHQGEFELLKSLAINGTITEINDEFIHFLSSEGQDQQINELRNELALAGAIARGDNIELKAAKSILAIESCRVVEFVINILKKQGLPEDKNSFEEYINYLRQTADFSKTSTKGHQLPMCLKTLMQQLEPEKNKVNELLERLENLIKAHIQGQTQSSLVEDEFIYEHSCLPSFFAVNQDLLMKDLIQNNPEQEKFLIRTVRDLYKSVLPPELRGIIDNFAMQYSKITAPSKSIEELFKPCIIDQQVEEELVVSIDCLGNLEEGA